MLILVYNVPLYIMQYIFGDIEGHLDTIQKANSTARFNMHVDGN